MVSSEFMPVSVDETTQVTSQIVLKFPEETRISFEGYMIYQLCGASATAGSLVMLLDKIQWLRMMVVEYWPTVARHKYWIISITVRVQNAC